MLIDYQDDTGVVKEEHLKLVDELLHFAAEVEGVTEEAELSVTFVDNARIQEINRDYRDKDSPTDVISFALLEETEEDQGFELLPGMPIVLGDIIISIDRTKEQAESYGHSFERELGFLSLHGFLHLLGYDHLEPEDERVMIEKQEELLNGFGLSRN
ncbi:probable rRNA maturation factor [Halolactibacillus alkaliphilus]|nr:probable rRNA maturation factor [Halolactibacillus alkaliphilus]